MRTYKYAVWCEKFPDIGSRTGRKHLINFWLSSFAWRSLHFWSVSASEMSERTHFRRDLSGNAGSLGGFRRGVFVFPTLLVPRQEEQIDGPRFFFELRLRVMAPIGNEK